MQRLWLHLTALGMLVAIGGCANKPPVSHTVTVEPQLLRMGHSETVTLSLKNAQDVTGVSLLPGGPYVLREVPMRTTQKGFAITQDIAWIATAAQRLSAVSLNPVSFGKILNVLPTNGIIAIASHSDTLAVAQNNNTIEVYEAHANGDLLLKTNLAFSAPVRTFAIHGAQLCIALEDRTIASLRIENGKTQNFQIAQAPFAFDRLSFSGEYCVGSHPDDGIFSFFVAPETGALTPHSHYRANGTPHQTQIQDNFVLTADGDNGMGLLELNDTQLFWTGAYNKLGHIEHVAADANKAVVSDMRGILSLINFEFPDTPRLGLDYHMHEPVIDLAYRNGVATVLTPSRIAQIDFSGEGTPAISNFGVNLGGSRRAFIKDDVIYVADWFSGMHLYDISLPHAPRLISSFHTHGSPKGVVVKDGVAFVADDDHGLQIVDVNNPRRPVLISHLPLDGLAYTMKLRDDTLYLASHRGGFHIIDVADVKHPKLVGSYDTPGKSWAVALKGNYAFVADDDSGVLVFDISKPHQLKIAARYTPGAHAEDIYIVGDLAYVAFFEDGLHVLDISDPLSPKRISHTATPGNARGIDIAGNTLYLASWNAGLMVLDISTPTRPAIVSQYDTKGSAWGVNVERDHAYVLDWWGGLKVINISNPSALSLAGKYQTSGQIQKIASQGNYLYLATGTRGLQVFDAKNSLNPVWATGVELDGFASDLAVRDQYAFVATGSAGLSVVDIGDPFQARWIATVSFDDEVDLITLAGPYALLAERGGALNLVDISRPEKPRKLQRWALDVHSITRSGDSIFIATSQGILSTSVNNLANSELRFLKVSPLESNYIVADEPYVFAATDNGISAVNSATGEIVDHLAIKPQVSAMYLAGNNLYATIPYGKLLVISMRDNKLHIDAEYPTTQRITMPVSADVSVFMAGEPVISSVELLPPIRIASRTPNSIVLEIPGDMPTGSYHLGVTYKERRTELLRNAFTIGFVKPKKPKFTLDDLKKKMQQGGFEGQAE